MNGEEQEETPVVETEGYVEEDETLPVEDDEYVEKALGLYVAEHSGMPRDQGRANVRIELFP